jgi:hypothetical protein
MTYRDDLEQAQARVEALEERARAAEERAQAAEDENRRLEAKLERVPPSGPSVQRHAAPRDGVVWKIVGVLASLCLALALAVAVHRQLFAARAVHATAGVVDNVVRSGRYGLVYCPVFSVTPPGTSAPMRLQGHSCVSRNAKYSKGAAVEVLYDPDDADSVEVAGDFCPEWIVVWVFGGVGAMLGLIAYASRRRSLGLRTAT